VGVIEISSVPFPIGAKKIQVECFETQITYWCTMQCNLCTVPPKTSLFSLLIPPFQCWLPTYMALLSVVILHNFIQSSSILSTAFTTSSNKSVPFVVPCILLTPISSSVILKSQLVSKLHNSLRTLISIKFIKMAMLCLVIAYAGHTKSHGGSDVAHEPFDEIRLLGYFIISTPDTRLILSVVPCTCGKKAVPKVCSFFSDVFDNRRKRLSHRSSLYLSEKRNNDRLLLLVYQEFSFFVCFSIRKTRRLRNDHWSEILVNTGVEAY
ncbi:hypothetical protein L9F63_014038, partial [Diploptera punctata]